jgi:predicted RNase H-like HicB family nuclease
MRYPIAIETGDAKHAFGVVVPDLPGCFSGGDTLDEALTKAREAILLHLEGLLDDGLSFPRPSTIEQLRSKRKRSYHGWSWRLSTSASLEMRRQSTVADRPETDGHR